MVVLSLALPKEVCSLTTAAVITQTYQAGVQTGLFARGDHSRLKEQQSTLTARLYPSDRGLI